MSSVRLRQQQQAKSLSKGKENEKRKEKSLEGRKDPMSRSSGKKVGGGLGELSSLRDNQAKGFPNSPSRKALGRPGQKQPAENANKSASCWSCQLPITDNGVFALGKIFHTACFRCVACGVEVGEDFHTRGEAACCNRCYMKSAERCQICRGKISGDHIQV